MSMHRGSHMTPDEFRRVGHDVIDWLADYLQRVPDLPVGPRVEPGAIRAQLGSQPPVQGESWDAILADLDRIVVPGLARWQHPGWYAYFPSNTSGPSVLGELVSAGLGEQGMLWSTSPALTELEAHVLDWLVTAFDLPASFRSDHAGGGVIQDSASSAALCAIVAARELAPPGPGALVAYASVQAHSSIAKGLRIAGVDQLRLIGVDEAFGMRPAELDAAIRADVEAGRRPFFACATRGSTSSLAFDSLTRIGPVCTDHGLWLHVDAAMAGVAALCPELRWVNDGVEHASSYCTNPHKWLFTNFDCSLFWVRDRSPLVKALGILPEYLRNAASETGGVIDYRDWQIPLGRRFRALKLWFVLRHYGLDGLRGELREDVALAGEFADLVIGDRRFELAAPPVLNLVCLRLRDAPDAATQRLLEAVNATGEAYMTHTRLNDRYAIRVCIGQTHTSRDHVRRLWQLLTQHAASASSMAVVEPASRNS